MVADIPSDTPRHDSVLHAIALQAAHAPGQQLRLLLVLSGLGLIAATVTGRPWSVLAVAGGALSGATASLALWELCRRAPAVPALRRGAQRILEVVGVGLWFLGGMALLLALLGDPWQL